jgi:hypothetical protein
VNDEAQTDHKRDRMDIALGRLKEKLTEEQFARFRAHFEKGPTKRFGEMEIPDGMVELLAETIYHTVLAYQEELGTLNEGFDVPLYGISMMSMGADLKEIFNG